MHMSEAARPGRLVFAAVLAFAVTSAASLVNAAPSDQVLLHPITLADASENVEKLIATGEVDPLITGNTTPANGAPPSSLHDCQGCGFDQPFPEALSAPLAKALPEAWVK